MVIQQYQDEIHKWASQFKKPYFEQLEILTRLTEEVGELAREVNHRYGPKRKKPEELDGEIGSEIADILMTLMCLANKEGINLDEHMRKLIDEKLYKRDNKRFERLEEK